MLKRIRRLYVYRNVEKYTVEPRITEIKKTICYSRLMKHFLLYLSFLLLWTGCLVVHTHNIKFKCNVFFFQLFALPTIFRPRYSFEFSFFTPL
jgi:hypothetical protein